MTDVDLAQWERECRDHVSPDRPLEVAFLRLAEMYREARKENERLRFALKGYVVWEIPSGVPHA